jgi:hypothetical protein
MTKSKWRKMQPSGSVSIKAAGSGCDAGTCAAEAISAKRGELVNFVCHRLEASLEGVFELRRGTFVLAALCHESGSVSIKAAGSGCDAGTCAAEAISAADKGGPMTSADPRKRGELVNFVCHRLEASLEGVFELRRGTFDRNLVHLSRQKMVLRPRSGT